MTVPTRDVEAPATWDPVPGDAPFIKIDRYHPSDRPDTEAWVRARVYLYGNICGEAEVPEIGVYKKENVAQRTAISMALNRFTIAFAQIATERVIVDAASADD